MAKPRRPASDPIHSFLDSFFKGLWWLVSWPFKGRRRPDAALEQAKISFHQYWSQIDDLVAHQQWREAVLQADIILDKALQWHKIAGNNLGERLKTASHQLTKPTLDAAWQAHKVRNRLAHELHYRLTPAESYAALDNIKKVLKELGLR